MQDTYSGPNRWQTSLNYRYQKSDRHFRGPHEEANRQAEGSEVINHLNLVELGIRYNLNPQWSFTLGIPYVMAERSSPLRDSTRRVVGRTTTEANELGDIMLSARHMLFEPRTHADGNLSIGVGLKFPTGKYDVYDERTRLTNGQYVTTYEAVDQSIQPGDGGFGFSLELGGFRRMTQNNAIYGSATYLFNPRGTNGTETFRGSAGEEIMSVADQYVGRLGTAYARSSWKGFGVSLGARLEGVPVEDVFGSSEGFRRPGYAISAEPGLSWSRGADTFTLATPIALYRNRTRSVPDRGVPGRIGDAAFADWVFLMGYGRRF